MTTTTWSGVGRAASNEPQINAPPANAINLIAQPVAAEPLVKERVCAGKIGGAREKCEFRGKSANSGVGGGCAILAATTKQVGDAEEGYKVGDEDSEALHAGEV